MAFNTTPTQWTILIREEEEKKNEFSNELIKYSLLDMAYDGYIELNITP